MAEILTRKTSAGNHSQFMYLVRRPPCIKARGMNNIDKNEPRMTIFKAMNMVLILIRGYSIRRRV